MCKQVCNTLICDLLQSQQTESELAVVSVVDASSPIVEGVLNVWTCSSLEGQDGRKRLVVCGNV